MSSKEDNKPSPEVYIENWLINERTIGFLKRNEKLIAGSLLLVLVIILIFLLL